MINKRGKETQETLSFLLMSVNLFFFKKGKIIIISAINIFDKSRISGIQVFLFARCIDNRNENKMYKRGEKKRQGY